MARHMRASLVGLFSVPAPAGLGPAGGAGRSRRHRRDSPGPHAPGRT